VRRNRISAPVGAHTVPGRGNRVSVDRRLDEQSVAPLGFDLTRLRQGEVTAVVGSLIVLVGLLVLPWYGALNPQHVGPFAGPGGTAPAEFGAWSGAGPLGTVGDLVILLTALAAIGVALAGSRGIELDGSGRRLFWLAVAASAVVVLRLVVTPGEISGYRFDAEPRIGIFFTLVGAVIIVWGAWLRRPDRTLGSGAGSSGGRVPAAE
jgi:hypothetical protein